ncbi:MAG: NAD(P)/FAD-dependent oxidoreductase [Pseudomonadota bacterium]
MTENDQAHRVVVVGGGFGGLACVKGLHRSGADITLIDQRNHHLFQPLLYQVATTLLPASEVAWPLRHIVKDQKNVTTLMATVDGVDRENKRVLLADGTSVPFDTLVLATGARHSYFGKDDWEDHAPGLKTLEDARRIRRLILSAFEKAERTEDEEERQALQTFAIIGAGPTGVELAGIIADLAHKVLPEEFRSIDTRATKILLIEAGQRVLPTFPEDLSAYTQKALEKLGVEVVTGHPVTSCDEDGIVVDGHAIAARTTLWAAGVKASRAAKWLDAEADRAGRVVVSPSLTLPGQDDIFIVGDTASIIDARGTQVPGVAPAAKQQGFYVARSIRRRLAGKAEQEPFTYHSAGNLATIGPGAAAVDFGFFHLKGQLAWWLWGIAHIYFLVGNRSRLAVAYSWLWSYISGQNSARLITRDPSIQKEQAGGQLDTASTGVGARERSRAA